MRVLWITNILFPDICADLGLTAPVTGGWLKSSAAALLSYHDDVELAVAACFQGDKLYVKKINGVTYYCLPYNLHKLRYDTKLETLWRDVNEDFKPEIVHIHGTEFAHGLAFLKSVGPERVVISIQGFVSGYARHEASGIATRVFWRNTSVRDLIRGRKSMAKRGKHEIEYIQMAKHVIGRTDWDRSHIWALNPDTQYHFCNETLRKPFYSAVWSVNRCERHRIFLSQASSPIKGLHQVIRALPLILRHFPDTEVYVAGSNFIKLGTLNERLRTTTYANIIRSMLRERGLEHKIHFIGPKDEFQMVEQYELANVFLCPSSIENSPNSLGEAQLVGTPCVASYVGGVPNMVEHGSSGLLYRFEEHEMLAKYVCDIFSNDDLAQKLSANGKKVAIKRHKEKDNADAIYDIYRLIVTCL